jgi:hypothetical protein
MLWKFGIGDTVSRTQTHSIPSGEDVKLRISEKLKINHFRTQCPHSPARTPRDGGSNKISHSSPHSSKITWHPPTVPRWQTSSRGTQEYYHWGIVYYQWPSVAVTVWLLQSTICISVCTYTCFARTRKAVCKNFHPQLGSSVMPNHCRWSSDDVYVWCAS